MITYDKYYQTPRMWLLGYDEVRTLLCQNGLCILACGEYGNSRPDLWTTTHSKSALSHRPPPWTTSRQTMLKRR
jgi:hypothetical protein